MAASTCGRSLRPISGCELAHPCRAVRDPLKGAALAGPAQPAPRRPGPLGRHLPLSCLSSTPRWRTGGGRWPRSGLRGAPGLRPPWAWAARSHRGWRCRSCAPALRSRLLSRIRISSSSSMAGTNWLWAQSIWARLKRASKSRLLAAMAACSSAARASGSTTVAWASRACIQRLSESRRRTASDFGDHRGEGHLGVVVAARVAAAA